MENQRTLLYITFFFILFLIWQAWEEDYGSKPVPVASTTEAQTSSGIPMAADKINDTPRAAMPAAVPQAQQMPASRKAIRVVTDLMDVAIDTKGGTIHKLDLRKYPASAEDNRPFELFSDKDSQFHVAQSGLISANSAAPNHHAVYHAAKDEYRLAEGENDLKVQMVWQDQDTTVTKVFTFHRDSYAIDVEHFVQSRSDWTGSQYRQLARSATDSRGESAFIYTYTGGVVFNDEIKYEKINFDDMADKNHMQEIGLGNDMLGGWVAMIQHYFLSAWVPDQQEMNLAYSSNPSNNRYILGLRSSAMTVKAGEQGRFHSQLVVGPKLQHRLEAIAPGLELVVDYGILTILAKPLYWVLEMYHTVFNNWGWAIIFLTLTVKLIFYKLSEASYRSMAKMRKVAPKMQAMKERYGDDRQRMSQAMMKMYKEEKINPLGGCLPILVQMPVFIALYWVLLESVEMRNAPFALWITNLSVQDPYYVLPVLMGASMFIQQKLNPAPMDPMQQKIFQIMPIMFTVFFLFFPAGLVLYWVVNNTLSIAQQWVITKRIENS